MVIVTDLPHITDAGTKKIGFYMDGYLMENLNPLPDFLEKAWDVVGIVSGHGLVGVGKCQPAGSKVLMSNGEWKNIENIKVADKVFSPLDDKSTRIVNVKEVSSHFSNDNYLFSDRKGERLFECSGNHLITLQISNYNKRTKEYKHLIKNMEVKELLKKGSNWISNHSAHLIRGVKIDKFEDGRLRCKSCNENLDPRIDPYFLGVYLGDGSFNSTNGGGNGQVCITNANEEIMNDICSKIKPTRIYNKWKTKAKSYRFSLFSEMAYELLRFGLQGKKSGNKFIPREALLSSYEYRLNLLAGLIDTDGTIGNTNGQISIITKSKQLAEDIQFLVRSLGADTNINLTKKGFTRLDGTKFLGNYFRLNFNFGDNTIIPLRNKFKKDRLKVIKQIGNGTSRYINFRIDKSEPKQVYGITLEGESQLYITDGFIITHNSTIAMQAGIYISWLLAGGRMITHRETGDDNVERLIIDKIIKPTKEVRFGMENIVFSAEELVKTAERLPKNSVIIYDEGRSGLDSASAMTLINKAMSEFFQRCRVYGHVMLIVLPNFFKLHEDYATSRSLFLIDAYADESFNRGYFNFYNTLQKERLFHFGKKRIGVSAKYAAAYENFRGKFTDWMPVDRKEYDEAKKKSTSGKEFTKMQRRLKVMRDVCFWFLIKQAGWTPEALAKDLYFYSGEKIDSNALEGEVARINARIDRENKIKED